MWRRTVATEGDLGKMGESREGEWRTEGAEVEWMRGLEVAEEEGEREVLEVSFE